jgi:hypothetical protein
MMMVRKALVAATAVQGRKACGLLGQDSAVRAQVVVSIGAQLQSQLCMAMRPAPSMSSSCLEAHDVEPVHTADAQYAKRSRYRRAHAPLGTELVDAVECALKWATHATGATRTCPPTSGMQRMASPVLTVFGF